MTGAPWTAKVVTLFPEMFPGPLGASLAGKALAAGLWQIETLDLRGFATDKHRTVDDTPFGGGPGMVMRPDVIDAALSAAESAGHAVIYLSPRGRLLDQKRVRALSELPGLTLLCGRYEGIDQRVIDKRGLEEISIGDYVLSGGEPAALVLIDACVRLLPGVMGAA
jgi:tRNA (guanine37-N1)-methyltransferase